MNDGKSIRALVGWADFLPMLTSHITSMGKRVAHPTLLMACALMLAGCAKQHQYETVEQICVLGIDKAEAMQIAEDVLAKMHFTIDKADVDRGIIITKPLPGAQFFEFWRSDNVGAFNAAEANLQSIRRIAQLNIRQKTEDRKQKTEERNLTSDICPLPQGMAKPMTSVLYIGCNVQVQRLSVPKFEIRNSKFEISALGGMEWIDLGKDTKLATEILKRIEQQIRNPKHDKKIKN